MEYIPWLPPVATTSFMPSPMLFILMSVPQIFMQEVIKQSGPSGRSETHQNQERVVQAHL